MAQRFEGKAIIVTGAGSGIGEATARRFAAEDAMVVLVDRNQAAPKRVAGDLSCARALAHVADVSDSHAVDDMVADRREALWPAGRAREQCRRP